MDNHSHAVNVKIYNHSYSIRANDGNAERAQRLADLVDQRMREIAVGALTSDTLKIAILAALHIADELDKANSRYDELNQQISSKSSELAEMLDQAIKTAK